MSVDSEFKTAKHFINTRGVIVRFMHSAEARKRGVSLPHYLRMKYDLDFRDRRVHGLVQG
jgi:hypothetical protein